MADPGFYQGPWLLALPAANVMPRVGVEDPGPGGVGCGSEQGAEREQEMCLVVMVVVVVAVLPRYGGGESFELGVVVLLD